MKTESDFKASVGKHGPEKKQCYNTVADQQMIQDLLNAIPENLGGAGGKLKASIQWGIVSQSLYQAILRFQKANASEGLSADGHVDPHEKTLRLLLRLSRVKPPDPVIGPMIHPNPDPLPNPGPDPNDDPNTVSAGDQFRIKMLEGLSFGEFIGGTSITFAIWDIKNNRAAAYEYTNVIKTVGTPITFTGEGAWSAPFSTPKFIQVDQFGGKAAHEAGGALSVGFLRLVFIGNYLLGSPAFKVSVPTGFSTGGGFEAGDPGNFTLVSGSVKVFSGP